jgi:hypothetical protein
MVLKIQLKYLKVFTTCQGVIIERLCASMMKVIISVINLLPLCCTIFHKLAGKSSQEPASWEWEKQTSS